MPRFAVALLFVPLLSVPSFALAEDFTGFYAGVNAGYGFVQDRHRPTGAVALPGDGAASTDHSLPPSAASASQAMQDARARSDRPSR